MKLTTVHVLGWLIDSRLTDVRDMDVSADVYIALNLEVVYDVFLVSLWKKYWKWSRKVCLNLILFLKTYPTSQPLITTCHPTDCVYRDWVTGSQGNVFDKWKCLQQSNCSGNVIWNPLAKFWDEVLFLTELEFWLKSSKIKFKYLN